VARPDESDPEFPGDDDEEALRWAGDEERGRDAPNLRPPDPLDAIDELPVAPGSRGRLAATVAFVVPYLAYAVAWIFAVQNLNSGSTELWAEVLWQFGEFLTILVAPLWLAATISLTRDSRPRVRVGWLALGLGVLVPWPFVLDLYSALQFAGNLS
jgi:hypothetical protein